MIKKTTFYIFPIIGGFLFLIVFLYAIGFLLNLVVPKSIDSGSGGPTARAIIINVWLITLFGIQHSIMARHGFKKWSARLIPEQIERAIYIMVSSILLVVVFLHWQPIKGVVWAINNVYFKHMLYGVFLIGCTIIFHSMLVIGVSDLLGWRQVKLYLKNEPYTPLSFSIPGAYKYIRHPIMLGTLLVCWATHSMSVGHLLFAAGMTCYVIVGTTFEERELIKLYGEEYRSYKRRVGMLVPFSKKNLLKY